MSVSIIGNKCCACRSCEQICRLNAISLKRNRDGYEQVCVDENACVECGLCEKVCPILNIRKPQNQLHNPFCGAAYAKDDAQKEVGSSGGLFGIFAQHIIKQGGVVYGAAFDNELQLKTKRATTYDELVPLYKSKYLLCNTGDSFKLIKEDLKADITVLYCSTPCQIAGLLAFLRKEYKNLICVEFACHGVGNQEQFDQSIDYLERQKKIAITHFEFRHKTKNAASSHYYKYEGLKSGKLYKKSGLYMFVPYYNAYCKQWVCREICYKCPYATEERNADITIGDFHTIHKFIPQIDRFKGVSMFLCNTEKGFSLFNSIMNQVEVFPMKWDDIKGENRFFCEGIIPKKRGRFLRCIREKGVDFAVKTMLNPLRDWKRIVYYNLPAFVRNKLSRH